jgi:hypothetical protein
LILKGLTLLTVNLSQFINQLMKRKVIIYFKIINSLPWMEAMSSVDNGFRIDVVVLQADHFHHPR